MYLLEKQMSPQRFAFQRTKNITVYMVRKGEYYVDMSLNVKDLNICDIYKLFYLCRISCKIYKMLVNM